MRKIQYILLAAGVSLFGGCTADEGPDAPLEATVGITIDAPGVLTRAAGDASAVDLLSYTVYDLTDGKRLTVETGEEPAQFPMSLDLRLVSGHEYGLLFFASAEGSPYTLTDGQLSADYSRAEANSGSLDAFYAYSVLTVGGDTSLSVELTRPFAMVAVGVRELPEGLEESALTVSGVPESVDLFTGELSAETADASFAFGPAPTGEEYPISGYNCIAYAFVPAPRTASTGHEVTCSYKTAEGETFSAAVDNVSLQANFRTNIYGNITFEQSSH